MTNYEDLKAIAGHFQIDGGITDIAPLGNGLINDTFKITTDGSRDYVLQRINHSIFTDPDLLQHNIEAVTAHLRAKLAGDPDIDRKVLRFIPSDTGKTWYFDGSSYWRISVFIPDSFTYEAVNPEYSYYAGLGFGKFEADLADLDEELGETIPDFHNMELRLRQLDEAIADDRAERLSDPAIMELTEAIKADAEEMASAERLFREGKLPKRICHCDTKVNNMLFDADGNILCIIDLDTVMPSFVFSDFGDFLRTAANTAAEDEPDTAKISFDMEIFKAFAKGYLESASSFLTPLEKQMLPYAALRFPYMQTVRFLADYLNGDTYYRIRYPEHNRVRSFAQWKLYLDAKEKLPQMQQFIDSL